MLPLANNAIADGVAENYPVICDTAITIFRSASHRAGVISSRGAHDSCSLTSVIHLLAIRFYFLNSSAVKYTFCLANLPLFDCSNIP